jgi:2-polyprenyl-3-methyl-5-hydroxy-6-metoxy-1,4-benzoquinol methylase
MMLDYDPLAGYQDAEAYDLEEGGYVADQPLIEQWARQTGGPLLDIACGTGTMVIHMAQRGYEVTGIDIVPEMIAHAKKKAAAADVSVDLQVADARDFHLNRQYAFVYLIGNAFQHFLTRADHEALLARVHEHLTPDGVFLFCTRNPSPRNLFEGRFTEPQTYPTDDGGQLIATEQPQYDPLTQIQHYTFHNQWLDAAGQQVKASTERTALRYVFPQEMESLLHYNGFDIHSVYGSWQQEPLTADSRSMIYVCQKRG